MSKDKGLSRRFYGDGLAAGTSAVNRILPDSSGQRVGYGICDWAHLELATRPAKDKLALFSARGEK